MDCLVNCVQNYTGVFIVLVVSLYLLKRYLQGGQFRKDHIRMDGKVVIITGANTGIGKETAIDLAKRGAKIYLACRDNERCEAAKHEIVQLTNNTNVFNRHLDLGSLESIRKFAKEFIAEENRLDVLLNNAGVANVLGRTKDGFEMQLGVNHLGHFLLTHLLLDLIKKSAPSRIINVSSLAHSYGTIHKEDFNSEKSNRDRFTYSQSKLANVLFTRELAKRLDGTGVTVNSLHPGVVKTEIFRNLKPVSAFFFRPLMHLFKTPKSGAQTQIRLAVDPDLEKVTGKYFCDCKIKKEAKAAQNDVVALWLWHQSIIMTGLENVVEK